MPSKGKRPQEYLENIYVKYFAAPIIVILGMGTVGTIIDGFLQTGRTFAGILAGVGGVGVIGSYFTPFWTHRDDSPPDKKSSRGKRKR